MTGHPTAPVDASAVAGEPSATEGALTVPIPEPMRFAARSMGSPLVLQVVEAAPTHLARSERLPADQLWGRVMAEFEASDQALSRFRDDSALTALNRVAGDGRWRTVELRLYRALAASARAVRITGGRFDPRVLVDLERLGYRGAEVAGSRQAPADAARGWLERDPRRSAVRAEMPLDSGGIGKGLALRWAWRAIEPALGGRGALLEAGGDLVGRGPGPAGPAWLVGIEDPVGEATPLAVVALASGALSTSSVAITNWRAPDGRVVHHLLDPRTGEPGGDGLLAVTVAGADPAWSEVWSKALFLAGRRDIADEARRRGLAAWWVEADGSLHLTPAARLRTMWTAARPRSRSS